MLRRNIKALSQLNNNGVSIIMEAAPGSIASLMLPGDKNCLPSPF